MTHRKKKASTKKILPKISRSTFVRSLSIFVVTFVVISTFFVMFGSDTFRIQSKYISVSFTQDDLFDYDQAMQLLSGLAGSFSFSVRSDDVFDLLEPTFPGLRQVDVRTRLPDGLEVKLTSFTPRFRTTLQ